MDTQLLYTAGLAMDGWQHVRTNNPRPLDGYNIEGFLSESYIMEKDGQHLTMGVYFLHGKEVYRSWIIKGAPHCVHYIVTKNGISDRMSGCVAHTIVVGDGVSAQLKLAIPGGEVVHEVQLVPQKYIFPIKGVTCASCAETVTNKLKLHPSVRSVFVSVENASVTIESLVEPIVASLQVFLAGTKYTILPRVHSDGVSLKLGTFVPLLSMFGAVLLFTLVHLYVHDFHFHVFMQYFMAGYFLLFGGLKVANWKKFVPSYRAYDLVAQKSKLYANVYPAIEFGLGVAYYFAFALTYVNAFVAVLMIQKALSVYNKIKSGEKVQCACLGGFFNIPITRVTLAEDLLMAGMALWMLFL